MWYNLRNVYFDSDTMALSLDEVCLKNSLYESIVGSTKYIIVKRSEVVVSSDVLKSIEIHLWGRFLIENTRSSMKVVTNVLIKIDWIEQGLDSSEGSLNGVNVHDRLNKWILFWSNPKLHSIEHSLTLFLDEAYLEHRMNQSSGEKLPWKLSRLRKWQSARAIAHLVLRIDNTVKNFRARTFKR